VKPIDIIDSLPRQTDAKYKQRLVSSIKRIVVHTTDWNTTPEKLARYDITPFFLVDGKKIYNHISKSGCPAITYHEIFTDSKVYKTLGYHEVSWHAGNWNASSLAVAMMYKCSSAEGDIPPSDNLLKVTQTRCGDICLDLHLEPKMVVGHRELFGTGFSWEKGSKRLRKTCPGMGVDLDLLRTNVAIYMQAKLSLAGLYKGKLDGLFGPNSKAALLAYRGI
jgi:hypothetical protein